MSDWCTNTSLEPSSGAMKPNPLVALNHLTVPTVILLISSADLHTQSEKSPTRSHMLRPLGRVDTHSTARTWELRDRPLWVHHGRPESPVDERIGEQLRVLAVHGVAHRVE